VTTCLEELETSWNLTVVSYIQGKCRAKIRKMLSGKLLPTSGLGYTIVVSYRVSPVLLLNKPP